MSTLSEALAPRSDQLNGDDLMTGPRVLKFTGVKIGKDGRQARISLNYEGDNGKPFKPCKTMGRAMVLAWAIEDGKEEAFIGKSVRVYRDPDVKFGDDPVGGIRISHMSHISKPVTMKLTVSQGKKAPFTFHPLVTDAVPANNGAARADAEKWLAKYEADIRDAASMDDLEQVHAKADRAMAKLERMFPDLHERALSLRTPPSTSADPDYGDRFTDDDTAGRARAEVEEGL